jgi:hypothetical protein
MTPEELRAIIDYLRMRVSLYSMETQSKIAITFLSPTEEEMVGAGLNAEGVKWILKAPWWEEMVTDILETPEYSDPTDPPQRVLEYARDVVSDYIRKRFPHDGKLKKD